jgi:hypothetical protein
MDIYTALIHHPVLDKRGATVTTAVTNLDIHDLARASRSYGVRGYYVVTPIAQQRSLVSRIAAHWRQGQGRQFNPVRAEAFETVRVASSLAAAIDDIAQETGQRPITVATGAAIDTGHISYEALRQRLLTEEGACLVTFGTGWGLTSDAMEAMTLRLPGVHAVDGRDGYNHLSVRSAVAIILDRLLGARAPAPR